MKSIFLFLPFLIIMAIIGGGLPAHAAPLPFTINMSENVVVNTTGGTPRIQMDVGGVTRYATYASGSGTNALVFEYQMVSGDVDADGVQLFSPIDLNGGTIRDTAGNNATLTFSPPNTSGVRVNAVPPTGYTVAFAADTVTNVNKAGMVFTLTYPKANKTLNYSIASSGGGTPITGTVTTGAGTTTVAGVNLTSLPDGVLTLSAYVTDSIGGTGPTVTDTIPMAVLDSSLVGHWTFDIGDISGTTAFDRSNQGNDGTLTNGPTQVAGQVGGALNFDGGNDYVNIPVTASSSLASKSQITIAAWIKTSIFPPAAAKQIFAQNTSGSGYTKISLVLNTNGRIGSLGRDQSADPAGTAQTFVNGVSQISLNQWIMVSGVYRSDIDEFRIYLNNSEDAISTTPRLSIGSSTPFSIMIGYLSGLPASQYFFGQIDDVRIYNRALTPAEITTLYTATQ